MAVDGATDAEISEALGISLNTIATYWKRLRKKWGVSKRSAVVVAHLRDSLRRELDQKALIEKELREAKDQLEKVHNDQRKGWNKELLSTQSRLYDYEAKALLVDYFDRSLTGAAAAAYELQSMSPVKYSFIRFDPALFGRKPELMLDGRAKFYDIIHEDDIAMIFELSKDVVLQPNWRTVIIYRHKCPDWRWMMDIQTPTFDETGALKHISGIAFDINDLVVSGAIEGKVVRFDFPAYRAEQSPDEVT